MLFKNHQNGFTLIELLIVVAIIGILAAIAVPNFLNAQIRAKIARTESELNSLSTALEMYFIDNNKYPPFAPKGNFINPFSRRLIPLTTPVSYISAVPKPDPLVNEELNAQRAGDAADTYDYIDMFSFIERGDQCPGNHARKAVWRLAASGPDGVNTTGGNDYTPLTTRAVGGPGYDYNPSNGLFSYGDIVKTGARANVCGEPFHYGFEPKG